MLRRLAASAVVLAAVLSSACYPVELSTMPDGRIVVPRPEGVLLYNPGSGEGRLVPPVADGMADAFAIGTPDGKWLVRAVRPYDGVEDPGSTAAIWLTNLAAGTSRELASFDNGTFLQVAPKDGRISWSFVSSEQHEGVSENMPELHVHEVMKGATVRAAVNVSVTHRWLPNGSGIVYLKTEGKDTDGRVGSLCTWDVVTQTERRVAVVNGAEWFDLSPDGREVVLSAQGMTAVSGRPRSRGDHKALYVVSLADGAFRRLEYDADHARYSPDGQRVAMLRSRTLWVTDRTMELSDQPTWRGANHEIDNGTKIHLSWFDARRVLAIARRPRLGVSGMSPELVLIDAATGEARNLQPDLDAVVRSTPGRR